MDRLRRPITIFVFAFGLAQPCLAGPIEISYLATDLPDAVVGEDRWEYRYFVSDFTFAADQGFSIYFDAALYTDLEDPPPTVNAGWDPVTFQPDPMLSSPGLYDALALVNGASLADPFVLTFTWLGGSSLSPASQLFTVNEFDASGLLSVLETGTTVPISQPVPEPATALLVGVGAAGAAWHSRRRCCRGRL